MTFTARPFLLSLVWSLLLALILQHGYWIKVFHPTPDRVAIPIDSNRTLSGDVFHYYLSTKRFHQDNVTLVAQKKWHHLTSLHRSCLES